MKLSKSELDIKNGIRKEWIITNGIGGFASSTVVGVNTRRYHGLLVAPLMAPSKRHTILSKLDEALTIEGETYKLYSNLSRGYVSDGYKNLESFEKKYIPIFEYKVKNTKVTKKVCMVYGRNTVIITYRIENGNYDTNLTLAPVVAYRDFHSLNVNHEYRIKQKIKDKKVEVVIDDFDTAPLYMYISDGAYTEHQNDIFKNVYYMKEAERGFEPEEDLLVTGTYDVHIGKREDKEITFICSLEENIEEIDGNKVIDSEIKRLNKIINDSKLKIEGTNLKKDEREFNEVIEDMVIATDNFVIYRPTFGYHSLLAGFPWFLDWGRDAFIAFEGLLLATKRYDIAREVLLTFTRDIKYGLVPNGYSEFDNRPLYNSVDSSLLLFEQVNKYTEYTRDYKFIKANIYESLKSVITNYIKGIDLDDNNIYLDEDYLLVSGTEKTQNTWMDAKIGDFAVTPRYGKAVEINALWYNALKTMEKLAKKFEDQETEEFVSDLAKKHKTSFVKHFYNSKKDCLYDCIGDDKIRPNQLFAISLTYPVMSPSLEKTKIMFNTCKAKLLTKYGLRTLAKGEPGYAAIYEGGPKERDMIYHQGVTWVWLIGLYQSSFKAIIKAEKNEKKKKQYEHEYNEFIENVYKTFKKELYEEECIGSISEMYDSKAPYKARGTCAQGWSISEILRIFLIRKENKMNK